MSTSAIPEVRAAVDTIREDHNLRNMRDLVTNATAEELSFEPAAGEWSILQILRHLGDIEDIREVRIDRILSEDRPVVPNSDMSLPPGERDSNDASALLRRYERLVERAVARLDAMTDAEVRRRGVQLPDPRVGRTGTIETSALEQVSRIPRHLQEHLNQCRSNLDVFRSNQQPASTSGDQARAGAGVRLPGD